MKLYPFGALAAVTTLSCLGVGVGARRHSSEIQSVALTQGGGSFEISSGATRPSSVALRQSAIAKLDGVGYFDDIGTGLNVVASNQDTSFDDYIKYN
jgi:hypothetical protein